MQHLRSQPSSRLRVLVGVKRFCHPVNLNTLLVAFLLLLVPGFVAGSKLKKIKASANPPAYLAFSKPLSPTDRDHHALDRLTFGARPGDFDSLQRGGLDRWLNLELHPEQVPENPQLATYLAPFQTLQMGIRDTYVNYPAPQMIAAVVRGKAQLPDDPELHSIVQHLAARYLEKKNLGAPTTTDANDLSDLDQKIKLSDLLVPGQIDTLHNGKP